MFENTSSMSGDLAAQFVRPVGYSKAKSSAGNFTDLQGLQDIKRTGAKDQKQALRDLSRQFESLFLNIMLKSMRQANAAFEEGGLFNSSEMQFHRDMFDQQLALTLSENGGVGLADSFYQQMVMQFTGERQDVAANRMSRNDFQPMPASASVQEVMQPRVKSENTAAKEIHDLESQTVADFSGDKNEFVQTLYPVAKQAAKALGVDSKLLVAQAALETGWGQHMLRDSYGDSSLNLFNIKAGQEWQGRRVQKTVLEFQDGVAIQERSLFRRYQSLEESFRDYVDFIQQQPRYHKALQSESAEDYIKALQEAGYATDPNYADKVMRVYKENILPLAGANAIEINKG